MTIGPPPGELGRSDSSIGARNRIKSPAGRRTIRRRFDLEPCEAGWCDRLFLHIFAGAGGPRRQPVAGSEEPIDLASMGGTINATYLDIASCRRSEQKTRSQAATPAAPPPPEICAVRQPPTEMPPPAGGEAATPRRRKRRRAARSQGRAFRARRREELRRPQGGERRQSLRPPGRSGRPARPERRRQDHRLLHGDRPDQGRQRPRRARRP